MFVDYVVGFLGEPRWNLAEVEAQFCCPFCTDSRYRFRINSITLKIHCFNCKWSGNAVKFVAEYQRVKTTEALDIVNFYQEFKPLPDDIMEEVLDQLMDIDYTPEKKPVPLPSDFKLLSGTKSVLSKKFVKYAFKRGLSERQLELHGAGFCPEGKIVTKSLSGEVKETFLRNRLILQAFDDEYSPIYWNARAINNNMFPKSINPTGNVGSINKSDVVFNLNNAKKKGFCVITEGIFDATTLGDVGVSLFGKTISTKQLLQIVRADLEVLFVMLDPDALEDAVKIAGLLSKHHNDVRLCNLKGGDPNEVGKKGCLEALKQADKFDSFTAIKYKLLN